MTLALKTSFSKMGLSLLALAGLGLAVINSAQAQTTADPNVLQGTTVTATNPFSTSAFPAANLTNGGTTPFVFADNGASPESVSITGFNSSIGTLRFFDAPDFLYRTSASVIIGYSSTANAGLAGTYTFLNGGRSHHPGDLPRLRWKSWQRLSDPYQSAANADRGRLHRNPYH